MAAAPTLASPHAEQTLNHLQWQAGPSRVRLPVRSLSSCTTFSPHPTPSVHTACPPHPQPLYLLFPGLGALPRLPYTRWLLSLKSLTVAFSLHLSTTFPFIMTVPITLHGYIFGIPQVVIFIVKIIKISCSFFHFHISTAAYYIFYQFILFTI